MDVVPFDSELWVESWRRREASVEHLVPLVLEALRPLEGERILDIGAGLAPLAIAASPLVGSSGEVLALDISEPVLRVARAKAATAGIRNLRFHRADVERDRIHGGPFDAATSLLGVMFFADPKVAFRNVLRHLRPGGRIAFAAWAEAAGNPGLAEVMLRDFAPPGTLSGTTGSFSLADPRLFREYLELAGFEEVVVLSRSGRVALNRTALFSELLLDVYGVETRKKPAARLHVQETLRALESPRGTRQDGSDLVIAPFAINVATARTPRSAGLLLP